MHLNLKGLQKSSSKKNIIAGLCFFVLGFFFLLLNFIPVSFSPLAIKPPNDKYDKSLGRLNSIEKITAYCDSLAISRGIGVSQIMDSSQIRPYFEIVNEVVELRFFHALRTYTLAEDWVSVITGSLRENINIVVDENEIIKGQWAFCGQQAAVLNKIASLKGVPHRLLGFDHHMGTELFLNNKWRFFDPDMEFERSKRLRSNITSVQERLKGYSEDKKMILTYAHFGNPKYRDWIQMNWKSLLFHKISFVLSKSMWMVCVMMGFFFFFYKKRETSSVKPFHIIISRSVRYTWLLQKRQLRKVPVLLKSYMW